MAHKPVLECDWQALTSTVDGERLEATWRQSQDPVLKSGRQEKGVTKDKHLTPRTGLRGVQGAFCGASSKPVYRLGDCDSIDRVEGEDRRLRWYLRLRG